MKRSERKILAGAISLAAASVASAGSINVQFGDSANGGSAYTGPAAAPDPNTAWNDIASSDQTDTLVSGTGSLSADVTVSGSSGGFTSMVLNPSHIDPSVPVGPPVHMTT